MGAIFLSYAREDRAGAECLVRVLESAGHSVWWDRHIDSGKEFSAQIEAELDKADIILVAWSMMSGKSRWVRDEAAVGGDTGRLVPVSLDGSVPPMGFRQFHTMDLTGWKAGKKDDRTAQLLHAISARLRENAAVSPPSPTTVEPLPLAQPKRASAWAIAAGVTAVLVAAALFLFYRGEAPGAPLKPTIALLPFTVESSDPALREIASQSRDSIAHTFSQSGLPVRLLNSAPNDKRSAVDFLISGTLSRNAEMVIVTIRLDEAAHGATVFSHRFEAGPQDIHDLPERVGAQMAGNLTWASPLMMLDRRQPIDPTLLADLLESGDFTGDELQSYQNTKRVVEKAPDIAIAQVGLAFNTAFILDQLPRAERGDAVAAARRAADRALALAPEFGDTYATWCILGSETLLAECEDRLRAGRRVDPDAPFLNAFLSTLLRNVGRFDESVELARLSYTHDRYVPTKIGWMLRMMEFEANSEGARELYREGIRWWPEYQQYLFYHRLAGMIDSANWNAMSRLEQEVGPKGSPADYRGFGPLAAAMKSNSKSAASAACSGNENARMIVRCMLILSAMGEQNQAYALADKLYPRRVGRTTAETERIWLAEPFASAPLEFITSPAAAPLRRDPRYVQLVQRVGLLDYWRSGRLPDFCRTNPEPICAQLRK
ncbi:MAG: TIR domain-containing protein [Sphingomicrobium sp.]